MKQITHITTATMALDLDAIERIDAHTASDWRVWLKSGTSFLPDEAMRHKLALALSLPFPWHATTPTSGT